MISSTFNFKENAEFCDSVREPSEQFAQRWNIPKSVAYNAFLEAAQISATRAQAEEYKAHAQRLADVLTRVLGAIEAGIDKVEPDIFDAEILGAEEALAQYNESPADADAIEALDQLEQLEGGE